MEYYSDFAIALYEEDFEKLCELAKNDANPDIRGLLCRCTVKTFFYADNKCGARRVYTMIWKHLKWYENWSDNFPEVQFIMDYINGVNHVIKILGEGEDDITIVDCDCDYGCLRKAIEVRKKFYCIGGNVEIRDFLF